MIEGAKVVIEQAEREDAQEILRLQKIAYRSEDELYPDVTIPPMTQSLEDTLEEFRRQLVLKAVEEDRIIGSVRAYVDGDTCYIGKLIVHPDSQNKGIGTKLMGEIESRFQDVDRYELFTGQRSKKDIYLYHKLGYCDFRTEKITEDLELIYMEKRAGS